MQQGIPLIIFLLDCENLLGLLACLSNTGHAYLFEGGVSAMGKCMSTDRTSEDPSTSYISSDERTMGIRPLHSGPIHALCAVDSNHLASGGGDQQLFVYEWDKHVVKQEWAVPSGELTKLCHSSVPCLIVGGSRDGVIHCWQWVELEKRGVEEVSFTLEGHTMSVMGLVSSPAYSNLLVSGSRDNLVCLWDLQVGCLSDQREITRNLCTDMCWVGSEPYVLQSSEDKSLKVWDIRSCSVAQKLPETQNIQMCCAVSGDGMYFASGCSGSPHTGGEVMLWDRRQSSCLREYSGHNGNVHSCKFLPVSDDHKMQGSTSECIVSCSSDSTLRIWEQNRQDYLASEYVVGAGPLTCIEPLSSGLFACSSFRGGVYIWNMDPLSSSPTPSTVLSLRAKY